MARDIVKDDQVSYWEGELDRAKKRYRTFWDNGDRVVDEYRQQVANGNDSAYKDKFNILYSSTETIRPNLYAQSPIPRVDLRNKDVATPAARMGALLLEGCVKYVQGEEDFDTVMEAAVEDYLLPGIGNGWVRYEAQFEDKKGDDGKALLDANKQPEQTLLDEMVKIEYVYWQDMLFGVSRTWKGMPWIARRCYLTKAEAKKRFGDRANTLVYAAQDSSKRENENPSETAEVWEIWDKKTRKVYWYADNQGSLLDQKDDPLKLKAFFPCPRPIRAISNTRTWVPRALYSQYKAQAETLNVLTKRIRLLGEALKVVGVFDGSQKQLSDILNANSGNKMIPIDNWAMFAQSGGVLGSIQWVPIDAVVKALNELLKAREICKQEIYEITGFSDIVRGVSKASETLGAQNIKADWAGARVKKMQAEVQRFARDLLALAGELIAEHCNEATIAVFSGIPIPTAEQVQADPMVAAQVQTFKEACQLIKSELLRTSVIDIETDSTLMANEQADQVARAQFLAAAGAFLQQAVPAMEATPQLGPLLGAMLMFTVRSFPQARIVEDEFEKVQAALAENAQKPKDDGKAAEAQAKQAESQIAQQELQVRGQEQQAKAQFEQSKIQLEQQKEQARHDEKMAELEIKRQELLVKQGELDLERERVRIEKFTAMHNAGMAEEAAKLDAKGTDIDAASASADRGIEERKIEDQAEARDIEAQERAQERAQDAAEPKDGD